MLLGRVGRAAVAGPYTGDDIIVVVVVVWYVVFFWVVVGVGLERLVVSGRSHGS